MTLPRIPAFDTHGIRQVKRMLLAGEEKAIPMARQFLDVHQSAAEETRDTRLREELSRLREVYLQKTTVAGPSNGNAQEEHGTTRNGSDTSDKARVRANVEIVLKDLRGTLNGGLNLTQARNVFESQIGVLRDAGMLRENGTLKDSGTKKVGKQITISRFEELLSTGGAAASAAATAVAAFLESPLLIGFGLGSTVLTRYAARVARHQQEELAKAGNAVERWAVKLTRRNAA